MGAFDPASGRTLPDRYIEGKCPICGFPDARGDQCDNCGNQLDPIDLINPHQRGSDAPVEFRETEHFFFDLPAFGEQLKAWIEQHDNWRPNVRKYSLEFVRNLKPRAITRDLDWGVPVPLPGWEDNPHKKIYVWFDAVIGYLSASIEWAVAARRAGRVEGLVAEPRVLALLRDGQGQHHVPHGAVAGDPDGRRRPRAARRHRRQRVPEHGAARSSRPAAARSSMCSDVLERYDADALRYYLMIAGPENQDTDFTWAEFVRRNNDELVATWGNLVHRTLVNAHRNFGAVPEAGAADRSRRGADRGGRGGARLRRRAARAGALPERAEARDDDGGQGQRLSRHRAAVAHDQDRPRARGHRAVRRAALRRQPEDDAHAVPAVLVAEAARDARLRRRHRAAARGARGRGGRRRASSDHRRLPERRPLAAVGARSPAASCPHPKRSSSASTRWSRRSRASS